MPEHPVAVGVQGEKQGLGRDRHDPVTSGARGAQVPPALRLGEAHPQQQPRVSHTPGASSGGHSPRRPAGQTAPRPGAEDTAGRIGKGHRRRLPEAPAGEQRTDAVRDREVALRRHEEAPPAGGLQTPGASGLGFPEATLPRVPGDGVKKPERRQLRDKRPQGGVRAQQSRQARLWSAAHTGPPSPRLTGRGRDRGAAVRPPVPRPSERGICSGGGGGGGAVQGRARKDTAPPPRSR